VLFFRTIAVLKVSIWPSKVIVTQEFLAKAAQISLVSLIPLSAMSAGSTALSTSHAINSQWHNFIVQELQIAVGVSPQALGSDEYSGSIANSIRSALQREISTALKLSETSALKIELRDGSAGLYDVPGLGLVRQGGGFAAGHQISPTLVRKLGSGELHIGGVFTYENFAAAGLGSTESQRGLGSEGSGGSALIVGWDGEVAPGLRAFTSFQSVTRMDEYRSYRGLFSEAGRFDQPARARAGFKYAVTPNNSLAMSFERVDYSAVKPFASRLLPDRFVSLLGDSASPTFAWQDLSIYRVGFDQQLGQRSLFSVAVSSSLQPVPTNPRLARALAPGSTDYTVSMGFERTFSDAAKLRFGASYMPFSYFFGPTLLSAAKDYSGARIEAEALFEVAF
jgi:hypothetical protein